MLSTRFFTYSVQLFSACLLMIGCTEFDALCTNNDHCLPHQYCAEQACVTRPYSNTLDLYKDPPFEEDMVIKADMDIGMEIDMSTAVDMLTDYEINEDPFTPPNPTCHVNFPNGESPILNIDNLAITPRLFCSRDVFLMIAPVNNDIPSMSKCHSIPPPAGEQTAGEQAGGEQAGDKQAGVEQAGVEQAGDEQAGDEQAGDEPTDRLAIYQYGRPDAQSPFGWYRRYPGTNFDPNTEFRLIHKKPTNDSDIDKCNKGLLYINERSLEKDRFTGKQSLLFSTFRLNATIQRSDYPEQDRLLNIFPRTEKESLTQFKVGEDNTIRNQISKSINDAPPEVYADCTSSFESLPNSTQDLKTWNPTLTKAGFAWMQTHPQYQRFGELHLVSRDSITRPDSTECDQVIIDLYDMNTQDPNQLWRMPLQYDHEQYLYYCRYLNGGACELHAKNVDERNNAYKQVLLKVSDNQEPLRLPTAKFSIYKNYLIYVSLDDSLTRFSLLSAQRSTDDHIVFERPDPLDTALRFPDLQLYLEKNNGNRLNAYWISAHPQGWQVKTKNIE